MKSWLKGIAVFLRLISSRKARDAANDQYVRDIHDRAEERIKAGTFAPLDTIRCPLCNNITLTLTRRSRGPDGDYTSHYICSSCAHSEDHPEVK